MPSLEDKMDGMHIESLKTFELKGHTFEVDQKYDPIKVIGSGAYGVVVSATDTKTNKKVAIKKINDWSGDWVDGLRILREAKLLRHFSKYNHPHLVGLNHLMASPLKKSFDEVYVVMEYMDTDMHKIIYSRNRLSDQHLQTWIHSTLRALQFMHSGNIIHRDLKPANLLLNKNCDLKVCDFGLARGIGSELNKQLTEYVVTRWYRAPELMCGCHYGEKIDVWALGCILGELLGRTPLFPGKDYKDQLKYIFDLMGTPKTEDIEALTNSGARSYIKGVTAQPAKSLKKKFPKASALSLDLMEKMLTFNQNSRISVLEALQHPWIKHLGLSSEDTCPEPLSFAFEGGNKLPPNDRLALQKAMWKLMREIQPDLPADRQYGKLRKSQASK